ncbi:unannotated protein [freshwater metagenome]|uniref:Unannotated protein n=1 Tax=freshwater metagenome TaxID=449393 RepID=A0A6J5ZVP1_9ZZZZ
MTGPCALATLAVIHVCNAMVGTASATCSGFMRWESGSSVDGLRLSPQFVGVGIGANHGAEERCHEMHIGEASGFDGIGVGLHAFRSFGDIAAYENDLNKPFGAARW